MDYMPYDDEEDTEVAHYRTAMVCEKGHLITDDVEGEPGKKATFCPDCGAKTLTTCPNCGEAIRGYYKVPHVADFTGRVEPPKAFCHACGHQFPWVQAGVRAWGELVEEAKGLSAAEKEQLKRSIDDLIADTAGTNLAVTRVKKLIGKLGEGLSPVALEILKTVGTEAVKRSLGM